MGCREAPEKPHGSQNSLQEASERDHSSIQIMLTQARWLGWAKGHYINYWCWEYCETSNVGGVSHAWLRMHCVSNKLGASSKKLSAGTTSIYEARFQNQTSERPVRRIEPDSAWLGQLMMGKWLSLPLANFNLAIWFRYGEAHCLKQKMSLEAARTRSQQGPGPIEKTVTPLRSQGRRGGMRLIGHSFLNTRGNLPGTTLRLIVKL